jgi:hypothetical protein
MPSPRRSCAEWTGVKVKQCRSGIRSVVHTETESANYEPTNSSSPSWSKQLKLETISIDL